MASAENTEPAVARGAVVLKALPRTALLMLGVSAALFLPAGRLDWPAAWALWAILLAYHLAAMFAMEPELVIERHALFQRREGRQNRDLVASILAGWVGPPSSMILSGLDVHYGWSAFPAALQVVAGAVMSAGFALAVWAARTNRFFSAVVRIQRDRGHCVVMHGPYRVVRHPGYAGFILFAATLPLLLGSWWALITGAISVGLYILRAAIEDRTLQRELAGYPEYAHRVRYRLLPGVW